MMNRRIVVKSLALAPLALPAFSFAQGFPNKPVQLIVGFPPGQASDVGARVVAERLGAELKQTVIVDNKVGAAGIIAHQFVKNAAADGYTLLYGSTGTLAINPSLYRKLPYDPVKDFVPVVLLNSSPLFLATSADTPVNNVREMIAYVKSKPGQLFYGSSGQGTTNHIAMELLKSEAGLDLAHVPFKGSPPMVTELIAGRVQFAFDVSTSILPHALAGRIKLIAISSLERLPLRADIPTVAEQGLPGFSAETWAALMAPAGTPAATIDVLNAAVNRALRSEEAKAHYAKTGSTVKGGSVVDAAQFIKREGLRWSKAVAASGAKLDF